MALLRLPVRAYQCRKAKRQKLDPLTADRLYRVAKIHALAASVFDSDSNAADWLKRPDRDLADVPLSLRDTGAGTEMVEWVLMRIEHGVYS